jgi:hypothetical protein
MVEMTHTLDSFAYVVGVEVIGPQSVRLTFEDGTIGDVDFTGEDWQAILAPLGDPATFAQVKVEQGTLVWPGGLDVAPEPLYREAKRRIVHTPAA